MARESTTPASVDPALERRTRRVRIVAQDPAVMNGDEVLTAEIEIPWEPLNATDLRGARIQIVDYDASTERYEATPAKLDPATAPRKKPDILRDRPFHAANVYAIAMRILARFELALGRRISWSFGGHQIHAAPHAFADANAYYSKRDQALLFGYFAGELSNEVVYSCLSHDIVAHETTHALLDGLRKHFDGSGSDSAAFHEGFADVVALLSVFATREVVESLLFPAVKGDFVPAGMLQPARLRELALFKLAEQMGEELEQARGRPLRHSVQLIKDPRAAKRRTASHDRGEVLVAAVLNAFVELWSHRLLRLREQTDDKIHRRRAAEEGSAIADALLTMVIRAIDYTPPIDLTFSQFLSALLTSDQRVRPDDTAYEFRDRLKRSFAKFGIRPAEKKTSDGTWCVAPGGLDYSGVHFEPLQRDADEVFRFLWANRKALALREDAHYTVFSVRPCLRLAPDGFHLRETVAEYTQVLRVSPQEARALKLGVPRDLAEAEELVFTAGGTLIFDEYGKLHFHIPQAIENVVPRLPERTWTGREQRFRALHLARQGAPETDGDNQEAWS